MFGFGQQELHGLLIPDLVAQTLYAAVLLELGEQLLRLHPKLDGQIGDLSIELGVRCFDSFWFRDAAEL
jgi:hypothetical protein